MNKNQKKEAERVIEFTKTIMDAMMGPAAKKTKEILGKYEKMKHGKKQSEDTLRELRYKAITEGMDEFLDECGASKEVSEIVKNAMNFGKQYSAQKGYETPKDGKTKKAKSQKAAENKKPKADGVKEKSFDNKKHELATKFDNEPSKNLHNVEKNSDRESFYNKKFQECIDNKDISEFRKNIVCGIKAEQDWADFLDRNEPFILDAPVLGKISINYRNSHSDQEEYYSH